MSAYYGYDSPDGRRLRAARRPADGALELAIIIPPSDGWGISIPASDVPSLLDGLREQAGLPRLIDYGDLHAWLSAEITDHEGLYADYAEQGDDDQAMEHRAMSDAFREVQQHIESETGFGS